MRLRQIALVARDLEPVVDDFCAVLGIEVAHRDPEVRIFGLCNAVMPIGETFLEVASPMSEDTATGRWLTRNGGDGGYMVIVQSENLEDDRARFTELGIRVAWDVALDDIAAIHLHPRDLGGAILSFDQPNPPNSWRWAGPDWKKTPASGHCRQICGVELQAPDPVALAQRWSRALARPAVELAEDALEISLEPGTIRFVPDVDGRGEGVSALQLAAADPTPILEAGRARNLRTAEAQVWIGGVRLDLLQEEA